MKWSTATDRPAEPVGIVIKAFQVNSGAVPRAVVVLMLLRIDWRVDTVSGLGDAPVVLHPCQWNRPFARLRRSAGRRRRPRPADGEPLFSIPQYLPVE
jgi:hypothetical protein